MICVDEGSASHLDTMDCGRDGVCDRGNHRWVFVNTHFLHRLGKDTLAYSVAPDAWNSASCSSLGADWRRSRRLRRVAL